jgi:hypothetical protein
MARTRLAHNLPDVATRLRHAGGGFRAPLLAQLGQLVSKDAACRSTRSAVVVVRGDSGIAEQQAPRAFDRLPGVSVAKTTRHMSGVCSRRPGWSCLRRGGWRRRRTRWAIKSSLHHARHVELAVHTRQMSILTHQRQWARQPEPCEWAGLSSPWSTRCP